MTPFWMLIACIAKTPSDVASVEKIQFEGNGPFWSGTGDYNLRNAMVQKQNEQFVFLDPKSRTAFLDVEELRLDAWRIENWYAHQGYFNAKFLGWELRNKMGIPMNSKSGIKGPVTVIGRIEEGERTLVRNVVIQSDLHEDFLARIRPKLEITNEDPFVMESVHDSESVILSILQENSYARAEVTAEVQVWPGNCAVLDHDQAKCFAADLRSTCDNRTKKEIAACEENVLEIEACSLDPICLEEKLKKYENVLPKKTVGKNVDVVFKVKRGPTCEFGEIIFHGDFAAPMLALVSEIQKDRGLEPGSKFSPSKLVAAQDRLHALGLFSVVNVSPQLDGVNDVLPVHISLTETKFREARVGGGFDLESGKRGVSLSLDFKHKNFLDQLIRLNLENEIGYTFISDYSEGASNAGLSQNGKPTANSVFSMFIPKIYDSYFSVGLDINFEVGLEPLYYFLSPSISPYLRWTYPTSGLLKNWFGIRAIDIGLAYEYTYFDFLAVSLSPDELSSQLGQDFTDTFSLSSVTQELILEGRDSPILTRKGLYAKIKFTEAGKILGGFYDYWRFGSDLRYFYSLKSLLGLKPFGSKRTIRKWLMSKKLYSGDPQGVIAFRFGSDFIYSYSDGDQNRSPAPYSEHIYLGGGADIRGWRTNHLGPYSCAENVTCLSDSNEQLSDDIVPIGGNAAFFGGMDFRRYWGNIGLVAFYDVGRVWGLPKDIRLSELSHTVGLGFRYKTTIGPLRLDGAYRIPNEAYFLQEPTWTFHFALAEVF